MFFLLSKTLGFFALPSNFLVSLGLVGVVLLLTRFRRTGRWLVVASLLTLAVLGLSPLGFALASALESRFPPWDATRGAPVGFIILGGALDPDLSAAHGTPALVGSAERLTVVAELARRYPTAKFIYSGGNANIFGGPSEADYVISLFQNFGVAAERLMIERRSRNTAENAVFSKALAAPKPGERWVVVTSAMHMPRAIGVFRASGFEVEAYPVDWTTPSGAAFYLPPTSFASGLVETDAAVRELVGLIAYRLTGRSAELFPAPR